MIPHFFYHAYSNWGNKGHHHPIITALFYVNSNQIEVLHSSRNSQLFSFCGTLRDFEQLKPKHYYCGVGWWQKGCFEEGLAQF